MKFLVLIAVLALATAQEYHDDVFHFSSLKSSNSISRPTYTQQVVQQKPVVRQQIVQTSPVYTQQVVRTAPVITQQVVRTVPVVTTVRTSPVYTQQVVRTSPVYTQQVVRTSPVYTQEVVRAAPAVQTIVQAAPQYSQISSSQYSNGGNIKVLRILEQVQEVDPSGPYRSKFSTENGIASSEQGQLTKTPEGTAVAKEGSYSYTGEDGQQYAVNWIADEYGFRASGAHLPTPPPIPAEIQRSLDLIASQPRQRNDDDSKK